MDLLYSDGFLFSLAFLIFGLSVLALLCELRDARRLRQEVLRADPERVIWKDRRRR
ncbi:MAG: hypothetical protein M5U26_26325 [Planctomycetota bacterium]|nr:hypothetical protein [Planctomycetota bacterium]